MEEENNNEEFKMTEEEFRAEKQNWKYKSILLVFITAIIVATVVIVVTYYWTKADTYNNLYNFTVGAKEETKNSSKASDSVAPISGALKTLSEVIDSKYIGEIDSNKLVDETVRGFVEGLDDEYSEYMTAEEWEEFQEDALGKYVGVGIYMTQDEDKNIVVVSTIKGTPAEEAGIQADDIIIGVDGKSTAGMDTEDVSNKVKGEEGTEVKLTINRKGEKKEFNLTRKSVKIYHVESKMLDSETGYISLITFDEGCADEFKKEMDNLINKGAKKIVFDLRYNTGGLVTEALDILDLFLDKGAITLITKDASGKEEKSTAKSDKKYDTELVVLVNDYSASASEIVTGALKDHKVAKIVGTKTYGKGVIQEVFSLNDGGVLKLTTSEYYTPNNTKINKVGIKPDYEVEITDEDAKNKIDTQLEKAKEILNVK